MSTEKKKPTLCHQDGCSNEAVKPCGLERGKVALQFGCREMFCEDHLDVVVLDSGRRYPLFCHNCKERDKYWAIGGRR